jgi:hypothetical protein
LFFLLNERTHQLVLLNEQNRPSNNFQDVTSSVGRTYIVPNMLRKY